MEFALPQLAGGRMSISVCTACQGKQSLIMKAHSVQTETKLQNCKSGVYSVLHTSMFNPNNNYYNLFQTIFYLNAS